MVSAYGRALRRLWRGVCDVYVLETVRNEANGRDEAAEVRRYQGEPCRLSYSSISSTGERDSAPLVQQTGRLFISKDLDIPAGSRLVVTQAGRTGAWAKSGEPAVYSTHQELVLVPFEEWA